MKAFDKDATFDRAFGSGSRVKFKGAKESEAKLQKDLAAYSRDKYPEIRFKSSLDGFNLSGFQRQQAAAIDWFEAGFPDMIWYHRNKKYIMLVLELKKVGGKTKKEHKARQQAWLDYLTKQGARAVFVEGLQEAKKELDKYMKL